MENWKWEVIEEYDESPYGYNTYRMKVPGGWIVRASFLKENIDITAINMIFIPDNKKEL